MGVRRNVHVVALEEGSPDLSGPGFATAQKEGPYQIEILFRGTGGDCQPYGDEKTTLGRWLSPHTPTFGPA
jgi:hypothetical protein